MSWLEKLLPPKIQHTDPAERRSVPEGLWIKCPSCETVLYKSDLEENVNVCPKCGHHHRIGARARLDAFLDGEGRYRLSTRAAGDGAVAGTHAVTLSQVTVGLALEPGVPPKLVKPTPGAMPVPEKYLRAETSGLTATVVPGENTFDFDLTAR